VIVKDPSDTGAQQPDEQRDSTNGRPQARHVTTARRLVQACEQARSAEDRARVAEEAVEYLRAAGDAVSTAALITLLELPTGGRGRRVVKMAEERLAKRAPDVVRPLLRAAVESRGPARENAADILERLPAESRAAGLIGVLAADGPSAHLKEAAADMLVDIGKPVAAPIFDALGERRVRPWIVLASGCRQTATDGEIMHRIIDTAGAVC
jgi:HEAT repeat protein